MILSTNVHTVIEKPCQQHLSGNWAAMASKQRQPRSQTLQFTARSDNNWSWSGQAYPCLIQRKKGTKKIILSPCSADAPASSTTVFFSHSTLALASSQQPDNSIFLSHHSSSSLQLQPAERRHEQSCIAVLPLFVWL